jgi:hypothetical protein
MKFPDPPKPTTPPSSSIGLLIAAVMLMPLLIVIKAFVISQLWEWYIVSHFGVSTLPMITAFGITLLANFIIHVGYSKDERRMEEKLAHSLSIPVIALLMGWIGTFFM